MFEDAALPARLGPRRAYVEAADPLPRYELAREVATLFETALTYRLDWLAHWSLGGRVAELPEVPVAQAHEAWQAALWARVARDVGVDRRISKGSRSN